MFEALTDKLQGAFRRLGSHGTLTPQDVEGLGCGQSRLEHAKSAPTVLMLVGLKGSGKTTTTAKLALHLRRQGENPLMVAADPERVAAVEQLVALGKQLSLPVFAPEGAVPTTQVCKAALKEAKSSGASFVIVDTG